MIHNTTPGARRRLKGSDIVELSKDQQKEEYEFDRKWFDKAMAALQDKRKQN